MSNAPAYYAVVQANFNPVAAMAKYIDEVQDRLRREGYALFEPQQMAHLQLAVAGQPPQVTQTTNWHFTKGDRSAGFVLNATSIAFHTTHYETNDRFLPELLRGLAAVHEIAQLEHVSRLGIRYLDAVLPQAGETVDQYLADGLHGVHFDARQCYALNESVFETNNGPLLPKGTLVVRVHRMEAPLGYPPDMMPPGLEPMPKFAGREVRAHAVIDTDHYVESLMPLEFGQIDKQLHVMHDAIKRVFEQIVTDYAREVWA